VKIKDYGERFSIQIGEVVRGKDRHFYMFREPKNPIYTFFRKKELVHFMHQQNLFGKKGCYLILGHYINGAIRYYYNLYGEKEIKSAWKFKYVWWPIHITISRDLLR